MAPFHPLRYETRAFVARALTAFAVFAAIAFVLLAGIGGHIASAEAKKDKGAAEGTGVVLQDGQNAQPQPQAQPPSCRRRRPRRPATGTAPGTATATATEMAGARVAPTRPTRPIR